MPAAVPATGRKVAARSGSGGLLSEAMSGRFERGTPGVGRWAAVRTVARNPLLARSLRGLFAFAITEQGCWLAILLFAFERGGVGEAGWVAGLLLLPAAVLAPMIATASDVFPRHRVLTIGYLFVAATSIGTGAAMLGDAPIAVVYALATAFSVLLTFAGPTTAAIIPTAANTADELTAANTATGAVEMTGRLAGPLLAGAILAVSTPGAVVVWIGALMTLGALSTAGRRPADGGFADVHEDDPARRSARVELTAGVRLMRRDPQVVTLTGAIATTSWIAGALDVGAAAIAVDILQTDDSAISVLLTGFGAGGLLGSALSFGLVGQHRLARALAASVILMCLSFAAVGWSGHLVSATGLLVLVGAGVTLTSVAGRTMLQGLTPDDTLARLFGVLEALEAIGLALGGLALSALAVRTDITTALAVVAGAGIVGLAIMARRLASIDRARRRIDPDLLQIARMSPVFSPLPPYAIEQVMNGLERRTYQPGEVLMVKGEIGRHICLVAEGSACVDTGDAVLVREGVGELLGEIALLREIPRTATVSAGPDAVTVYWMEAAAFLDAVNRVPRSRARADAGVRRRLAADPSTGPGTT